MWDINNKDPKINSGSFKTFYPLNSFSSFDFLNHLTIICFINLLYFIIIQ